MGVTWVSVGGLGEGRGMFRGRQGVPHPGLVRQHSAASHKPGTETHSYSPVSSVDNSYFYSFSLKIFFKSHCFLLALVSHDQKIPTHYLTV